MVMSISTLNKIIADCQYDSVALDETTDIGDGSELLICVKMINEEY